MIDTQSLRQAAHETPRKQEDVPTPFWPGTDGHFAFIDVPSDEITDMRKELAEGDPMGFTAAILCRALINKHTGEQAFPDTDRDFIKKLGSSVTNPLARQLMSFLNLGDAKEAIKNAKND